MEAAEDQRIVRTRQRVRAAVQALLLSEGLAALSHQQVAERAGVGRATLYRHWPARSHLLREALGHAEFPKPAPTGVLRHDLTALLEALRAALVQGPLARLLAVLLAEAPHDADIRHVRNQLTMEGHAALQAVLQRGVDAGELPPDLPVTAWVQLLGGAVFYEGLVLGRPMRPADVQALVDEFLRRATSRGAG